VAAPQAAVSDTRLALIEAFRDHWPEGVICTRCTKLSYYRVPTNQHRSEEWRFEFVCSLCRKEQP
jgi:hypothetical protein